ncbi:MAG: hypothetical protein RSB50_08865 [Cetobacterium sp.]
MKLKLYIIKKSYLEGILYEINKTKIAKTVKTIKSIIDIQNKGPFEIAGDVFKTYSYEENLNVIKTDEELSKFKNALNNDWIYERQYYIRHPKQNKKEVLIEAEKFLEYIYREQAIEIIHYLKSKLNLKKFKILFINTINKKQSWFAKIEEEINLETEIEIEKSTKYSLNIDSPEGFGKIESSREYIWLKDFGELEVVTEGFLSGSFKRVISVDNTFDVGLDLNRYLGFDISNKTSNKVLIEFEV